MGARVRQGAYLLGNQTNHLEVGTSVSPFYTKEAEAIEVKELASGLA